MVEHHARHARAGCSTSRACRRRSTSRSRRRRRPRLRLVACSSPRRDSTSRSSRRPSRAGCRRTPYDARAAWEGAYPDQPEMTMRVEAAAFRGRPVYFEIVDPWNQPTRQEQRADSRRRRDSLTRCSSLFFVLVIVGRCAARAAQPAARARRPQGRVPPRGFVLRLHAHRWLFAAHHVPDARRRVRPLPREPRQVVADRRHACGSSTSRSSLSCGGAGRRRIISWNRLLAGDWRDPLVGRDILLGAVFGFGLSLVGYLVEYVPHLLGRRPRRRACTASPSTPCRARSS